MTTCMYVPLTPRPGKGPVFPTTAPSVLAEEVKLVAAGLKKRRGSYESYLSFTVASINGVRAAAGQLLAPHLNAKTQLHLFIWVTVTKIKIMKFSTPENYPPYGIR